MTDNIIKVTEYDTVVVTGSEVFNIVIDNTEAYNVITEGIQGPPGVSGIGGYESEILAPEVGDILTFSSDNKWINIRRTDVSDGGNF